MKYAAPLKFPWTIWKPEPRQLKGNTGAGTGQEAKKGRSQIRSRTKKRRFIMHDSPDLDTAFFETMEAVSKQAKQPEN